MLNENSSTVIITINGILSMRRRFGLRNIQPCIFMFLLLFQCCCRILPPWKMVFGVEGIFYCAVESLVHLDSRIYCTMSLKPDEKPRGKLLVGRFVVWCIAIENNHTNY